VHRLAARGWRVVPRLHVHGYTLARAAASRACVLRLDVQEDGLRPLRGRFMEASTSQA
jgi:hypothetical protein